MRRSLRVLALALLLALVAAACGDDDARPNPAGFCDVNTQFAALGGFLDTPPDEAASLVPQARQLFQEGLDSAPAEIRPAYRTIVDAFTPLLDVFEDSDFGASEVDDAALEAALLGYATPEVQQANADVEAWVTANCNEPG